MKEHFGKNLKVFRTINGDTQTDLARRLKVSNVSVVNWEKGRNFPRYETLGKIAEIYHCSINDLLSEKISI